MAEEIAFEAQPRELQLEHARSCCAGKDYGSALRSFQAAEDKEPLSRRDEMRQLSCWIALGQYEKADKRLTELQKSGDTKLQIDARLKYAELLQAASGEDAAIKCLDRFLQEYPENTSFLYHKALMLHEKGFYRACTEALNRCLDLQPTSVKARILLLDCYLQNYSFTLDGKQDKRYRHLRSSRYAEKIFRKLPMEDTMRLDKVRLLLELCDGALEWTENGLAAAMEEFQARRDWDTVMSLLPWLAGGTYHTYVEEQGRSFLYRRDYGRAYACFQLLGKAGQGDRDTSSIWMHSGYYMDSFGVRHIEKHFFDDKTKPAHGVFDLERTDIISILDHLGQYERRQCGDFLEYWIPWPKAGHEGGSRGVGRQLNAVIVIVNLQQNRIVTAYPGDQKRGG